MSRRRMSVVDATSFIASSLIVLTPTSKASVAIGLASVSSDFPDHCIEDANSKAYPIGAEWNPPNTCSMARCMKRGNTMYVSYESCGFVEAELPCTTVSNKTAQYPACCPRVVCEPPPLLFNEIDSRDNEIDIDDYGLYDDALYMMSSDTSPTYLPFNDYPDIDQYRQSQPSIADARSEHHRDSHQRYTLSFTAPRSFQRRSDNSFRPIISSGGVPTFYLGGNNQRQASSSTGLRQYGSSSSVHDDIYQAAESIAVATQTVPGSIVSSGTSGTANLQNSYVQPYKPYSGEVVVDNRPRFFAKLPTAVYVEEEGNSKAKSESDQPKKEVEQEEFLGSPRSGGRADEISLFLEALAPKQLLAQGRSSQIQDNDDEYDWDRIFAGTSLA